MDKERLQRNISRLQKENNKLQEMLVETENELNSVSQRSQQESNKIKELLSNIMPAITLPVQETVKVDKAVQSTENFTNLILAKILMIDNIEEALVNIENQIGSPTTESFNEKSSQIEELKESKFRVLEKLYKLKEKKESLESRVFRTLEIRELIEKFIEDDTPSIASLLIL